MPSLAPLGDSVFTGKFCRLFAPVSLSGSTAGVAGLSLSFGVTPSGSRSIPSSVFKKMGFATFDRKTLERGISPERLTDKDAGPLWSGPLFSKDLLRSMRATGDLGTAARCSKVLETWREEVGMPPCFFGMDELAQKTKLAPPKLLEFVAHLVDAGAKASRTHFDPKGLKTDLTAGELLDEYKRFAKTR